ncbi:MAG: Holliday junction resolvase RuvX [Cytophagales bacterium]
MARIIALDYGRKRTGIATTDPLQIIATSIGTIRTHDLFTWLKDYFSKEAVETIVLGFPTNTDGEDTDVTQDVRQLQKKLTKDFPDKTIELVDERFTSSMALRTIREADLKKKDIRNKNLVDAVSATIILQSFLEKRELKR